MPFAQGDLPTGEYPVFTLDDDTPCPATIFNDASWPDGSKRMCGVFFRTPTSIAATSSLNINVKGEGSAPAASSRTLSDLTAADIKVELTGVTNLSGVWVASLNDAITDATDIVEIGDGPAGKVWRITGPFKQGGTAHGQLHCWHYVMAAENQSGGLAHLRHTAYFGQMFADVASPTPARVDATGRLLSGATVIRTMQGYTVAEGSITGTFALSHYTLGTSAGADGKWDFIQGGGTQSAEATVRAVVDNTYVLKAHAIPPVDLSRTPADMANVDYVINGKGNHQSWAMPGTGERDEIGLIPEWSARYWINQSAANEKAVRVNALCAAGYHATGLRSATKKPIPVVGTSFAGLTVQNTWTLRSGIYVNVSAPSPNAEVWQSDMAHRPAPTYSAYIMTGEPQFLDLMIWHAFGHVMFRETGYREVYNERPIATAVNVYAGARGARINGDLPEYPAGGVIYSGGGIRMGAWSIRDIGQAFCVCPDAHPDGADYKGYLAYVMDSAVDFLNDYAAGSPETFRDGGLLVTTNKSTDGTENYWMDNYVAMSMCHISAFSGGRSNLVTLRQYFAKRYPAIDAIANVAMTTSFQHFGWDGDGIADSWGDILFSFGTGANRLTMSTATNNVTLSVIGTNPDWNFTNGDCFMFHDANIAPANKPYAEMGDYIYLYVVNASGKTCQFSLTLGGSPLTVIRNYTTPDSAGATGTFWGRIQDEAVGFLTGGPPGPNGTWVSIAGTANYHEALGDPVSVQAAKLRAGRDVHLSYAATVDKYAFTNSIPV